MLYAYRIVPSGLAALGADDDLAKAAWIDLHIPDASEIGDVTALGIAVPSLADMEEIEISNRLYRDGATDYMTVVLSGLLADGSPVSAPVTFILTPRQLVTVRHHEPRPFRTFPDRAARSSAGVGTFQRVFFGLVEEIVARQADLLELSGKALDATAARVYGDHGAATPELLQAALTALGREGEVLARVRLGLLTIERMLSTYSVWTDDRRDGQRGLIKGMLRDINALEVHADFLSGRVSLISDTTLGMVNLAQNATVRIVSVVAALFLPPTLIASVYGMNFAIMPELSQTWGYPMALVLMVASALLTYLYFKWKRWL